MTKSVQRFPFLSYMGVGHHLVALWAAKALTIKNATKDHMFAYHIFGAWPWYNNGSLNIMAKPMKPLELHYPVIQFLKIRAIRLLEAVLILKGTYNPGPCARERVMVTCYWYVRTHRFTVLQ